MAVENMRKGKTKFERKRKRCKLCRGEMEATGELKIVRLLKVKVINVAIC